MVFGVTDHGDGSQDTGGLLLASRSPLRQNATSEFPRGSRLNHQGHGSSCPVSSCGEQERKQSGEPVRFCTQRRFDGGRIVETPAPRPFSYEPKPYGDKELAFWHQYGLHQKCSQVPGV